MGDLGGVFYGLPLYPFFLALVYKLFGLSYFAVKWVQLTLGVGTVYLVYQLGTKFFDRKTALVGAWLAVFYGPLSFHELIFIPEALGIPLYAGSLLMAIHFFEKPDFKRAIGLGILFGFAMLSKAGILLFVFLFLLFFIRKSSSPIKIKSAALCLLSFFLTLAPVTLHNLIRGKDFVLLTSHAGFNFYVGNHPGAEGVFSAPEGTGTSVEAQMDDSRAIAEREMGRTLKPSEISHYWSSKAWKYILDNPGEFLKLCGKKLVIFFDSREISDVEDYYFCGIFSEFIRFPWPNFVLLCPLLFAGLYFSFRARYGSILYLWIASYLIGMVTFFVNARYRLPMLPVFFLIGAFGAVQGYENWKKGNRRELAFGLIALACGIFVSQAHLVGTDFVSGYVNAGDAIMEKNDYDRALAFYDKAIEVRPDYAKAHLGKALCLTHMGRREEAVEFYKKSIELDPKSSQAWNNLGLWYDQNGDAEKAEEYFLKAIELKPSSSQAHNNLGTLYGKRGEIDKATAEFEKSLAFNPASAKANSNLALMVYKQGDAARAKTLWEKALELDPNYPEAKKALTILSQRSS